MPRRRHELERMHRRNGRPVERLRVTPDGPTVERKATRGANPSEGVGAERDRDPRANEERHVAGVVLVPMGDDGALHRVAPEPACELGFRPGEAGVDQGSAMEIRAYLKPRE